MTFGDFLKVNGGKWETVNGHFSFNSLESYKEAEIKLEKVKQGGEGHIMSVTFGGEFNESLLVFQIQFGLEQKEVVIAQGETWKEQKVSSMKEAFDFMRKVVDHYFDLLPLEPILRS